MDEAPQTPLRADLREQLDRIADGDWRCLYHAAVRIGLDGQAAETVVHEALQRAFRSLGAVSEEELLHLRVHAWLKTLTEEAARRELARSA